MLSSHMMMVFPSSRRNDSILFCDTMRCRERNIACLAIEFHTSFVYTSTCLLRLCKLSKLSLQVYRGKLVDTCVILLQNKIYILWLFKEIERAVTIIIIKLCLEHACSNENDNNLTVSGNSTVSAFHLSYFINYILLIRLLLSLLQISQQELEGNSTIFYSEPIRKADRLGLLPYVSARFLECIIELMPAVLKFYQNCLHQYWEVIITILLIKTCEKSIQHKSYHLDYNE